MKKTVWIVLSLMSAGVGAQIEVDKPIQLTGTGSNARIEGVEDVSDDHHAANKIYVDTTLANALSGGGGSSHYLGEVFGGGVIYSLAQDGLGNQTGLIVSPVDESTGKHWSANTSVEVGTNNYDGLSNSNAIHAQNSNSAASLCVNSTQGGFTDWYLPSFLELRTLNLNQLYAERGLAVMSGSPLQSDYPYWSSSEWYPWDPSASVININFASMSMNIEGKSSTRWVRCVRAF